MGVLCWIKANHFFYDGNSQNGVAIWKFLTKKLANRSVSEIKNITPEQPSDFAKVVFEDPRRSGASRNLESGQSADPKLISSILIPRWVVYFQAALLGIVASTFFVFGLMVGCLTSEQGQSTDQIQSCVVTGAILYETADGLIPDAGAVVFLLPKDRRPQERSPGSLVSPSGFEPLNNPGIEIINRLGGAVVRTDELGKFNLTVDGSRSGIEYFVLVVSKHKPDEDPDPMTRQQVAAIGTFFMPVDRVIDGQVYHWSSFTARGDRVDLGEVEF